jgi:hypothetical protein
MLTVRHLPLLVHNSTGGLAPCNRRPTCCETVSHDQALDVGHAEYTGMEPDGMTKLPTSDQDLNYPPSYWAAKSSRVYLASVTTGG